MLGRHDLSEQVPRGLDGEEIMKFCKEKTVMLMFEKLTGMGRHLVMTGILPADLQSTAWGQFRLPIKEKDGPYWNSADNMGVGIVEQGVKITGLGELHMHAPGDFHLQHHDAWRQQRGYPEVEDKYFLNLDSWMVAVSYGARLAQEVNAATVDLSSIPPMYGLCMAFLVVAYIVMAYIVMACIIMVYIVMVYIVMACIIMAYIVMAIGAAAASDDFSPIPPVKRDATPPHNRP